MPDTTATPDNHGPSPSEGLWRAMISAALAPSQPIKASRALRHFGPIKRHSNATHSHEINCCQTLTDGPEAIGKRKGSAISALQIKKEKSCLAASSAPACIAKKPIQGILPGLRRYLIYLARTTHGEDVPAAECFTPCNHRLQRARGGDILGLYIGSLATPSSVQVAFPCDGSRSCALQWGSGQISEGCHDLGSGGGGQGDLRHPSPRCRPSRGNRRSSITCSRL